VALPKEDVRGQAIQDSVGEREPDKADTRTSASLYGTGNGTPPGTDGWRLLVFFLCNGRPWMRRGRSASGLVRHLGLDRVQFARALGPERNRNSVVLRLDGLRWSTGNLAGW